MLVNDALALLAALDVDAITAAGGKAAEAVAMLALVAGQDVEPAEGSDGTDGRWRIARKVAPDRVISTVDPEARHAHKTRERRQDGFKAHLAVEPDTGLATAAALTKVNGPENSDAAVGAALLDQDPTLPAPAGPDEQGDEDDGAGRGAGRLGLRLRGACWTGWRKRSGRRRSSPSRCGPRWRAGSPSTTSSTTTPPAP